MKPIAPSLRRQLFTLRNQGLTYREIAERTGVAVGTLGYIFRHPSVARIPLDPPTPFEDAWRSFRRAELGLKDDHFYSTETFIT